MLSFNWSVSLCLALHLIQYVSAQSSANAGWTAPPASAGDFAEQYTNGDNSTLSWKALNHSTADLWLTAYDPTTDGFAKFLTGAIDLSVPGAFRWNIAIAGVILSADGRIVLRFVNHREIYYPGMTDQIPSPAFIVKRRPQDEPLSTSSSSTESSTTTDSSTSTSTTTASEPTVAGAGLTTSPGGIATTPTPATAAATSSHNDNNSLSDGSIAGIAIGSAAAVAMFLGLGILIGARRRRHGMGRLDDEKNVPPGTSVNLHEHAINRRMSILTSPSAFAAPSTYAHAREFQGNSKQPVELDTRPADRQGRGRDSKDVGAGAGGGGGGTDQGLETPTLSNPSNSGTFSPTTPPRMGDSTLR